MIILLTNDDGYQAQGLQVLEAILSAKGHEVWVCAPSDQQSAQSHAMTLKGKVKIHRYGLRHYHCSGTPSDCILYGLEGGAVPVIPDVIISGINHGYNASTDILYSGTVGAASEGALRGYPSMAISARNDPTTHEYPFELGATFLSEHLEQFLPFCTSEVLININIPPLANGKWRVGHIGQLEYLDVVERTITPRNTSFDAEQTQLGLAYGDEATFILNTKASPSLRKHMVEADFALLAEGFISVTPLLVNPSIHEPSVTLLKQMQQGLD
ncbi:MAG: 5'/3'-nucleotidase SurE [Spirochaetia bacterium]|nr:5'/3'-nucleotidase SurE [Spirochaetia bacterium]